MRLAGFLLIIFAAQPAFAQHSLSFPLSDPSVPVWHGWLYDDGSPHNGIDYKEPLGTPILAADDGIAMSSVQPLNPNNPGKDVYGLFILIQHPNGLSTLYAHLSRVPDTIYSTTNRYNHDFALWTPVKKGDVIGFVGTSGVVTTHVVHLHFEAAINPQGDYTGHVTHKADPYDIKNLALYYPPTGPKFASCGTNFLWLTCPIGSTQSVTFLTFTEGNPGIPGDGILIDAERSGQFFNEFELSSPIALGKATDGITITVFPGTGTANFGNVGFDIGTTSSAPCSVDFGGSPGLGTGRVISNGAQGVYTNVPQSTLVFFLNFANQVVSQLHPGCTLTLNDLQILALEMFTQPAPVFDVPITSLDAASLGFGQNAYAGTPIQ